MLHSAYSPHGSCTSGGSTFTGLIGPLERVYTVLYDPVSRGLYPSGWGPVTEKPSSRVTTPRDAVRTSQANLEAHQHATFSGKLESIDLCRTRLDLGDGDSLWTV